MLESSGTCLAKGSHVEIRIEAHQGGRSLLVVVSLLVLLMLGRRGAVGSVFLMCYSPQSHHYLHLLLCRLVCFPIIWINGGALLPAGF